MMEAVRELSPLDRIRHLVPCPEAARWLVSRTEPQAAWDECSRGDWMLWLIGKTITSQPWSDDRKPLLACALDCAEIVRHLWPAKSANEIGKLVAVLRAWIVGDAATEQAKEASKKFYAPNYTAAGAAYAAYAAAATYAGTYAAYAADYVACAYADADAARGEKLSECADIVRRHYPAPPNIWPTGGEH